MKIIKFNKKYYKQVNDIYKNSFPKEERYSSLNKLISYIKKEYAEMYCIIEKNVVYGYIYSIKYRDMVFILYLAVDKSKRSCGCGSNLLNWYLKKYNNIYVYLNIDEIKENADDIDVRKKRLKFYEKNGLHLTEYLSVEENCTFNILSNKNKININDYKLLDEFIAELLEEPISKIVKL